MDLNKFMQENCLWCGTQRCDPSNIEWLEGCRRYRELKEKEKMSKRYKFYSDGANKIVAVSSYAGRTVRGVAKCDPRDNFNRSKGEELAQARCNLKVATKRFNRAISEVEKAKQAVIIAQYRVEKMESYLTDAHNQLAQADRDLKRIESEL